VSQHISNSLIVLIYFKTDFRGPFSKMFKIVFEMLFTTFVILVVVHSNLVLCLFSFSISRWKLAANNMLLVSISRLTANICILNMHILRVLVSRWKLVANNMLLVSISRLHVAVYAYAYASICC
jgi:hypothetical protein